jgi:NAD(P)-dependent dehydrogenase (short-subunit alcohol dehydrogenase family)
MSEKPVSKPSSPRRAKRSAKAKTKIIVVTGATRGLGRAMVERFVELGHTVWGCGRAAANIVALRKRFGPPHDFVTVDVSRDEQVESWAKKLIDAHGPPDLLVNNAAVINRNADLWEVSADDFQRVVEINIIGVVNCIRHFVPAMVKKKSGVIVNFSSGWGRSTSAKVATYCATKFAIEGLTQALAQELPAGMAAIPLNPGVINTDMLQSCFGSTARSYPGPEEWSRKAAPFLLSLDSTDNGQPLSVGD